jgi:crotonobetainyl-CoA:carnitine CoA-transferase CaiB-like acyl-CoA transferase
MMNSLVAARPVEMGLDGLVRRRPSTEGFGGTETGGEGTAAGGAFAASYVAAALARRERTGEGCYIDVSAADSVVSAAWVGAVYALNEHRITDRETLPDRSAGSYHGAKYQFYETKDQRFMLFCAIEHKFWDNFCRGVDRPDLLDWKDETGPVDWGTHPGLRRILQEIFHQRTQQEWIDFAIAHDVAMGPTLTDVKELLDNPHLAARQILVDGCHPEAGPFTYIGVPAIVDGQRYAIRRPAPTLGADTDEILTELGYDPDDIDELRHLRVV